MYHPDIRGVHLLCTAMSHSYDTQIVEQELADCCVTQRNNRISNDSRLSVAGCISLDCHSIPLSLGWNDGQTCSTVWYLLHVISKQDVIAQLQAYLEGSLLYHYVSSFALFQLVANCWISWFHKEISIIQLPLVLACYWIIHETTIGSSLDCI